MLQTAVHYGIHFIVPLLVALFFFKPKWKMAFLIMILTFVIDLDHVLANPIYDANRCSINFHPLHSYFAIVIYMLLLIPKVTRLLGIGLCIHILADYADCLLM
ncbi:MAG: hypothetical protein KDC81_11005 [Flavobacteriaceae bacterium]|nr:hypothetical protein [Flavobacteriaceae bacterium]